MPRTKSGHKRVRQTKTRQTRLQPYSSHMKTMSRKVTDALKAGNKDEAIKLLPVAYKSIDMAQKKHIIHQNTAARRKSLLARSIAAAK